jgi:hypothetical protein
MQGFPRRTGVIVKIWLGEVAEDDFLKVSLSVGPQTSIVQMVDGWPIDGRRY